MPTEFDLLPDNANEIGLPPSPLPAVTRVGTEVDGHLVSALKWTADSPRIVLLHGGGQNAHTWDSVLLALGVPALAIDLPGHGHSAWRDDHDYRPLPNAPLVAATIREHAPDAELVVGMSLGGLTTIAIAAQHPDLISRAVLVDVSPESPRRFEQLSGKDRGTVALAGGGPDTFDDLDELIELTATAAPNRSRSSIRRGVIHNTRRLPDGRWQWRYDRMRENIDSEPLWDALSATTIPYTLVRGGASHFVADADVDEYRRRLPDIDVITVPGSGHSVQSDAPLELADIIRAVLDKA
ncbi:alpha/beta hydrolase [Williamsia sp. 1135]|uniref:alpha/beta fold hydrolase n=1 Tax=Williamsia sp. 1135 TaxID=1889262 RepID=UPI000A116F6E|nr:alpha/beta hydrolase [Williamsia sp. 1135]ORM33416.1 alpha/beta hydrolase [Williamsia sp. 1135]